MAYEYGLTETPRLSDVRKRFASELQDPEVARLLNASVQAEVGGQGSDAQQAYIESVINRASALDRPLKTILTDPSYYPTSTKNKLGNPNPTSYQDLTDKVLQGSNLSNLATGNESGNVHSGGAPVMFSSGGERFVREGNTKDWTGGTATPDWEREGTSLAANQGPGAQGRSAGDIDLNDAIKSAMIQDYLNSFASSFSGTPSSI